MSDEPTHEGWLIAHSSSLIADVSQLTSPAPHTQSLAFPCGTLRPVRMASAASSPRTVSPADRSRNTFPPRLPRTHRPPNRRLANAPDPYAPRSRARNFAPSQGSASDLASPPAVQPAPPSPALDPRSSPLKSLALANARHRLRRRSPASGKSARNPRQSKSARLHPKTTSLFLS